MGKKSIISLIIVVIFLLGLGIVGKQCIGYLNADQWGYVQAHVGEDYIQTESGLYWKGFGVETAYNLFEEFTYSDIKGEGEKEKESIRVTFNDGSTANISSVIVVETPVTDDDRIAFHKMMTGNPNAVKSKVKAHLTECLKSAAPFMSSTEHQVSRKSDFSRIVEDQLTDGIYDTKRVYKTVEGRIDEKGDLISVEITEILLDEKNKPVIAKQSPLTAKYKMTITQFSIKRTDYDEETLLQFAAKKKQFLNAETSKSEREAMVQEALKIQAEGLKDKAQAEADANVKKATAVIAAKLKAEVAEQVKIEAETKAQMALSVATTQKEQAGVDLDRAKLDSQAIIVLAEAEKKRIELAGALTELEQAKIDAQVQMAADVSSNLSKIQVPMITMGGNGGGGKAGGLNMDLVNLKMMVDSGILEKMGITNSVIKRTIDRTKTSK